MLKRIDIATDSSRERCEKIELSRTGEILVSGSLYSLGRPLGINKYGEEMWLEFVYDDEDED